MDLLLTLLVFVIVLGIVLYLVRLVVPDPEMQRIAVIIVATLALLILLTQFTPWFHHSLRY